MYIAKTGEKQSSKSMASKAKQAGRFGEAGFIMGGRSVGSEVVWRAYTYIIIIIIHTYIQ